MKSLLLSVCLLTVALSASAGGFSRAEQSQKALGLGGAYSAIGRDASVMYYNPGALVRLDTHSVSLGLTAFMPRTVFRGSETGAETLTESVVMPIGYAYGSYQISRRLAAGLAINTPFAYNTKWADNWEGRSIARHSSFYSIFVQPTLSFSITDKFSIGAGFVYARGQMQFARQIGEQNIDFEAEASGSGIGYNVGLLGSLDEFVAFSVTYRSAIEMDLNKGDATFGNTGAFGSFYPASTAFRSRVDLPSALTVGLRDRISDKVAMVFEFSLTNWSTYDSLRFEFPEMQGIKNNRARLYEDAMAFRAGIQYAMDSTKTFRAGIFYDESPVKDPFLSAEQPDANMIGATLGASYMIAPRFELDASYSMQIGRERSIQSNSGSFQNPTISGTYKTLIHTGGIGLNYYF